MIEHKFKLTLDNTKEQIYYERPSFSLDGKQFICVVSSDYKISDSSILQVQVDANTPINMRPITEEFIEQGETVIYTSYKVLNYTDNEWIYILYDDGCIKTGQVKDGKITFNELNISVNFNKFNEKEKTIELPTTYYIEDGKLTIHDNVFNMVMDSFGISSTQRLWDDYVCFIRKGKRGQWVKKTRLTFTITDDIELPIQLLQLAKRKNYIYYKNNRYEVTERWSDSFQLERYVTIDGKTFKGETDERTGYGIFKINDNVCQMHYEFVPSNTGEIIYIYADTDSLLAPITTDYFIVERIKEYEDTFYVENNKISVLGYDYDVTSDVIMIDFDGWKEAVNISDDVYSIVDDEPIHTLFKKIDKGFVLFSNTLNGISDTINVFNHKKMDKTTVNGVDYYKEDSDEIPFLIPIQPKYRLNIIDYTEPSLFACQLDLDEFEWLSTLSEDKLSYIREDIYYNLRSYSIKYQQPQFMLDKSDEQTMLRRYNDLYGMPNIDPLPNVSIVRELHDVVIDFPIYSDNGTNLFQEIWVKDKFIDKKKQEFINPIVDMEKDVYFPMKLNKDNILEDVTAIEFYLHFRTRNNSWEVNEDFKTGYLMTNDYDGSIDSHLEEIEELNKTSWNVFDYYEKEESKPAYELSDETVKSLNTNDIYSKEKNHEYYQPSDLLSFLDFGDDDVFYQKSKISKSFLRISFFDTNDPKTQSLLGTSTVFLNGGVLFGIFSDVNSNEDKNMVYLPPTNWKSVSPYISVNREPVEKTNDRYELTFDETKRLSSKLTVTNNGVADSSSEGFYNYIFREFSEGLHERKIYAKFQFNHAGNGTVIDLFQPMIEDDDYNLTLPDMSLYKDKLKEGMSIKEMHANMYIPIYVKYDLNTKKYCWYLPKSLSDKNTENKIKFNLYEVKVKNYDSSLA